MKIKYVIAALLLSLLSSNTLGGQRQNDYATQLPGTWLGNYHWVDDNNPNIWIRAHNEDRYAADGTVEGFSEYQFPNKTGRLEYRAEWHIDGDYLIVTVTEAKGGFIRPGSISRDKILSLTDSTLTLLAEDGETLQLRRSD